MANYVLPNFNTEVYLWHMGSDTADPPDVIVNGNFSWDRRSHSDGLDPSNPGSYTPLMTLLVPRLTDIRGYVDNAGDYDVAEIPSASGRFYIVHYVDFIGCQFPNEHLGAEVYMPAGHTPPPPPPFGLIAENGDLLTTESSDILTTE